MEELIPLTKVFVHKGANNLFLANGNVRYIIACMHHNIAHQLPIDGGLGYHSLRILNSYGMRIYNIVLNSNLYYFPIAAVTDDHKLLA